MVFECAMEWKCLRALSTPLRCHRPLVAVLPVSLNTLFFPATVYPPLGKSAINPVHSSRALSVSYTSNNARQSCASRNNGACNWNNYKNKYRQTEEFHK
jgi:hypothetical protein